MAFEGQGFLAVDVQARPGDALFDQGADQGAPVERWRTAGDPALTADPAPSAAAPATPSTSTYCSVLGERTATREICPKA